jgi:pyruvate formate lyase activating enzyme
MGSLGCNFACDFCQNWAISQGEVPTRDISPECAVSLAREAEGNVGLAYTYNEPLMWYEYLLDTAPLIREAGMKNVLVTNGFINEEPLRRLLPYIDAMNIDVKSMRDDFYRRLCHGRLAPVLRAVEMAHAAGCWVELTCLVIPGENDRDDDFEALASWVANLSPDIPVHFSRYHPAYRLSQPATPTDTLERAYAVAREKLRYVYVGNVPGGTGENTRCPHCDKVVIERVGYSIQAQHLADGKCRFCGEAIAGIGST